MERTKPYLDEHGDLIIPFECADHKFKYWKKEGATLAEILDEIEAPDEVRTHYLTPNGNGK